MSNPTRSYQYFGIPEEHEENKSSQNLPDENLHSKESDPGQNDLEEGEVALEPTEKASRPSEVHKKQKKEKNRKGSASSIPDSRTEFPSQQMNKHNNEQRNYNPQKYPNNNFQRKEPYNKPYPNNQNQASFSHQEENRNINPPQKSGPYYQNQPQMSTQYQPYYQNQQPINTFDQNNFKPNQNPPQMQQFYTQPIQHQQIQQIQPNPGNMMMNHSLIQPGINPDIRQSFNNLVANGYVLQVNPNNTLTITLPQNLFAQQQMPQLQQMINQPGMNIPVQQPIFIQTQQQIPQTYQPFNYSQQPESQMNPFPKKVSGPLYNPSLEVSPPQIQQKPYQPNTQSSFPDKNQERRQDPYPERRQETYYQSIQQNVGTDQDNRNIFKYSNQPEKSSQEMRPNDFYPNLNPYNRVNETNFNYSSAVPQQQFQGQNPNYPVTKPPVPQTQQLTKASSGSNISTNDNLQEFSSSNFRETNSTEDSLPITVSQLRQQALQKIESNLSIDLREGVSFELSKPQNSKSRSEKDPRTRLQKDKEPERSSEIETPKESDRLKSRGSNENYRDSERDRRDRDRERENERDYDDDRDRRRLKVESYREERRTERSGEYDREDSRPHNKPAHKKNKVFSTSSSSSSSRSSSRSKSRSHGNSSRVSNLLTKRLTEIKENAITKEEPKPSIIPKFFIDENPIAVIKSIDEETKALELSREVERVEKTYRVLGQDRTFKTQEKNLIEKLNKYIVNPESVKEEKKEEETKADEGDELDPEFGFDSRYFFSNPTQVCNRCKKPGHFEKWCTEEVKILCLFCLGRHKLEECTQIVCFNCLKVGHRRQDCSIQGIQMTCYRCGKRGHKSNACGILIMKENTLSNDKEDFRDFIYCMRCEKIGHYCEPVVYKQKSGYLDDMYMEEDQMREMEKSIKEENKKKDSSNTVLYLEGSESDESFEELSKMESRSSKSNSASQSKKKKRVNNNY